MLMPRLFFEVPARVKRVLLLMVVLPCVPGLTFLLAGWARDPDPPAQDAPFAVWAKSHRAERQAFALHRAGVVALVAGVLCGAVIAWKIARQREADEEEEKE